MKNVIFIAPPAAGKGTISNMLKTLGYEHISMGDLLREEIAKNSSIGLKVKDIMSSGKLISDDIVYEVLSKKFVNLDNPFILDGFPRTLNQAKLLDDLFSKLNISDYKVIYLDIKVEEALKRALSRLTCKCGLSYNTEFKELSPKIAGICDVCHSKLEKRSDDNEESLK